MCVLQGTIFILIYEDERTTCKCVSVVKCFTVLFSLCFTPLWCALFLGSLPLRSQHQAVQPMKLDHVTVRALCPTLKKVKEELTKFDLSNSPSKLARFRRLACFAAAGH